MPFLMGIHSSMMERVRSMPINDVVILDMDNNEIESPYYEDLLQLPPDVVSLALNANNFELQAGGGERACSVVMGLCSG